LFFFHTTLSYLIPVTLVFATLVNFSNNNFPYFHNCDKE